MSSSLQGKPVLPSESDDYGPSLKFALRKRYGEPIKAVLDSNDIPYLQGLGDAGLHDASKLIALILIHGKYEVWEEY